MSSWATTKHNVAKSLDAMLMIAAEARGFATGTLIYYTSNALTSRFSKRTKVKKSR
jgi:hypothetical protein